MSRMIFFFLATLGVWLVLTSADPASLLFGIPAAAGATWLYHRQYPAAGMRLWPSLRFAAFFLAGSIRGAVDIAWRLLRLTPAVEPVHLSYPTQLHSRGERMLLAATVTLMPGTAATGIGPNWIGIHSLVPDPQMVDGIVRCEALVAALNPDAPGVTNQ